MFLNLLQFLTIGLNGLFVSKILNQKTITSLRFRYPEGWLLTNIKLLKSIT